jgi:rubrerythrin
MNDVGINESKTFADLVDLFAREAQTLVRFWRFASTARYEGFHNVATMFERMAQNQLTVVEGHLDFLRNISDPLTGEPLGPTEDNLRAALAAETESATALYPSVALTAATEGFASLASWFQTIAMSKDANVHKIQNALNGDSSTPEVRA